jgi:uncharacterized small protein (DUF1192 family)
MDSDAPDRQLLNELLAELNDLEQRYGRVRTQADPLYRSSGEVNSRVALLKEKIARLGATLSWAGDCYQIVESPGKEGDD